MKENLTLTRYYLYLIKHEPPGWQEEIERMAEEELVNNPEFKEFVKSKLIDIEFKGKIFRTMQKLARDKKNSTTIYMPELTPSVLYFKYAYEKEFDSMSKQEQEWWIEREVSLVKEKIDKKEGNDDD